MERRFDKVLQMSWIMSRYTIFWREQWDNYPPPLVPPAVQFEKNNVRIFTNPRNICLSRKRTALRPTENSMPSARNHNHSLATHLLSYLASDLGLLLVAAVIILAVYAIDTVTPLGEPVWLLYFIPLILSYWSTRYYAIPTVFIVTILFLVAGFLVSPQGIPVHMAILSRFTFFLLFFIISLVLWTIRGRQIREETL
jgi:hypothetical protein